MADLSQRAQSLGTENAFVVLAEVNKLIREGRNIISFCIGQPDFATPQHIQDAGIAAIQQGKHGYTPSAGIPELRQAAADYFSRTRGIQVDADDVVVGAGAKVLGGFTVGDGAKIGSNAVVTKPVPAGATAVGNPARIIEAKTDAVREEVASKMGFSAYGVTQNDDPLSQAIRGLIDYTAEQDKQIAMLWQALEKLSNGVFNRADCVPEDAAKNVDTDIEKLNKLID